MNCKKCDAELQDDMTFCPICGTAVEKESKSAEEVPAVKTEEKIIPPPPQPIQKTRKFTVKQGRGGGWIVFAKILLWLVFAGIILIGVSSGIMLIMTSLEQQTNIPNSYYYDGYAVRFEPGSGIVIGIAMIIGSVILAFVTVCSGFLLIDACLNLKNMNDNLAELIKINAETGNTTEKINAAVLEIMKKK